MVIAMLSLLSPLFVYHYCIVFYYCVVVISIVVAVGSNVDVVVVSTSL